MKSSFHLEIVISNDKVQEKLKILLAEFPELEEVHKTTCFIIFSMELLEFPEQKRQFLRVARSTYVIEGYKAKETKFVKTVKKGTAI